jgi:hypothetical protein
MRSRSQGLGAETLNDDALCVHERAATAGGVGSRIAFPAEVTTIRTAGVTARNGTAVRIRWTTAHAGPVVAHVPGATRTQRAGAGLWPLTRTVAVDRPRQATLASIARSAEATTRLAVLRRIRATDGSIACFALFARVDETDTRPTTPARTGSPSFRGDAHESRGMAFTDIAFGAGDECEQAIPVALLRVLRAAVRKTVVVADTLPRGAVGDRPKLSQGVVEPCQA